MFSNFKMSENALQFRGSNPGAAQFGNFINYYQFHPPEHRLKLLPKDLWQNNRVNPNFTALDIGCNSGDLTIALYDLLSKTEENCRILGVDIDPTLIKRANEKNSNKNIEFLCTDLMNETQIEDYLKKHSLKKFDAVFCFSLTMWIHLNNGDEGLAQFLKKVTKIAKLIVVEPQPWKCYKTAVKRLKTANFEFPFFKQLKMRNKVEEDIENLIISNGCLKIWESLERTQWKRKIQIFQSI